MTRVLGIIGEIGAGKSAVAARLAEHGIPVLDADKAGHEILTQPEVIAALVREFGPGILETDRIDRRKLAAIVFQNVEKLRTLESIVHPRMKTLFRERMERARREGTPWVALDAAVLLEAGWDDLCDHIVYVTAPRAVRLARVASQRGWTEAELTSREKMQMPLDTKRARAQTVLDNGGSLPECVARVDQFLDTLRGSPGFDSNLSDPPKIP